MAQAIATYITQPPILNREEGISAFVLSLDRCAIRLQRLPEQNSNDTFCAADPEIYLVEVPPQRGGNYVSKELRRAANHRAERARIDA